MSRNGLDEQFIENLIRRTVHTMSEDESSNLVKVAKLIADTQEFVAKIAQSNHSIAQELINQGAFDVAKNYIDFLKAQISIPMPPTPRITHPPITQSSKSRTVPKSSAEPLGAVATQKTPTPPSETKKPIVGNEKHA
jgi:hypothetical protein